MPFIKSYLLSLLFFYFYGNLKHTMTDLQDISNLYDIQRMVDTFYTKVRTDNFIGPIFNERIGDRWDVHLHTLYSFWESILLGANRYNGRPFPPHAQLPIGKEHFEHWLGLFIENIDSQFQGPIAEEAKLRALTIANVFLHKLASIRGESIE
jgi:hemoglobin